MARYELRYEGTPGGEWRDPFTGLKQTFLGRPGWVKSALVSRHGATVSVMAGTEPAVTRVDRVLDNEAAAAELAQRVVGSYLRAGYLRANDEELAPAPPAAADTLLLDRISCPGAVRSSLPTTGLDCLHWRHHAPLVGISRPAGNRARGHEHRARRDGSASLERLVLRSGGLPQQAARSLAAARLPALKSLEMWLGAPDDRAAVTVEDLVAILDGRFGALTHRGLRNAEASAYFCWAILTSEALPRLRSLDLSFGSLNDEGAALLVTEKDRLARLELLDVSGSVSDWMCDELALIVKELRTEADERYFTAGE